MLSTNFTRRCVDVLNVPGSSYRNVTRYHDSTRTARSPICLRIVWFKLLSVRFRLSFRTQPLFHFHGCSWNGSGNFKLLGAPVGSNEWCEELLGRRIAKARSLLAAIGKFPDAQGAFSLLRSCSGWSKVLYSCRTVPPDAQMDGLRTADSDLRAAPGQLIGRPSSGDDWRLASLGIAAGGLGARCAAERAPAAYVASFSARRDTCCLLWPAFDPFDLDEGCHLAAAEEALRRSIPPGANMYEESDSPSKKFLSGMIEAQSVSDIFGDPSLPRHRRLHLEACHVPGAGAWLTANPSCVDSHVPSPFSGLLSSAVFAWLCGITTPLAACAVKCWIVGATTPSHAAAATPFGMWSAPQSRSTRRSLPRSRSLASSSPLGRPIQEAPTRTLIPPSFPPLRLAAGRRPADIWVPRGVSGFAEAWDFSVSSLLRSSHLSSASPSVADVFHEVEQRKRAFQDTASHVAERGATFCPLVLEACGGGWSQAFRSVVAWISSESRTARGHATDAPRDISLRIAQRISCTLHRENARAILRRSPGPVSGSSDLAGDQVPTSGW